VVVLADMRFLWASPELGAVWSQQRAAIRGGVIDAAAGFLNRMDEVSGYVRDKYFAPFLDVLMCAPYALCSLGCGL
jgi:hypothetical protein